MEVCQKIMTMGFYDILSGHCRLPGGVHLPFITGILKSLILDIFYRVSVFQGRDKAETLYCFKSREFLQARPRNLQY